MAQKMNTEVKEKNDQQIVKSFVISQRSIDLWAYVLFFQALLGLVFRMEVSVFAMRNYCEPIFGQNTLDTCMGIDLSCAKYLGKRRKLSKWQKIFFNFVSEELPTYKKLVEKIEKEILLEIGRSGKWFPIDSHLLKEMETTIEPGNFLVFTYQDFGFDQKGRRVQVIVDFEKPEDSWDNDPSSFSYSGVEYEG